jgi:hypothetical protein
MAPEESAEKFINKNEIQRQETTHPNDLKCYQMIVTLYDMDLYILNQNKTSHIYKKTLTFEDKVPNSIPIRVLYAR